MWEIFQQDLRQCLQHLNQIMITWQIQIPERKPIAKLINQLQKLVAGGLLLQANDLSELVKKLQLFIEDRSLKQTKLNEHDNKVLQTLNLVFDTLAHSKEANLYYIASKEKIKDLSLLLTLTEHSVPVDDSSSKPHQIPKMPLTDKAPLTGSFKTIDIINIFNQELKLGINLLTDCVLKIEQGTARLNDYKEMMRCAHSLRGSAKIAGLNNVVPLAHSLENIFTKVQEGEHYFKSNDIDVLMQLIDMLLSLSSVETGNLTSQESAKLSTKSIWLLKKLVNNEGEEIRQITAEGNPTVTVEDLVTRTDKSHLSVKPSELGKKPNNKIINIKKNILVVDDSLTIREVQRSVLEAQGYKVDVAVDGIDGWNHLHDNTYDLLITDIEMPRLNGWELLDKVKNHTTLNNLPVIVVSSKDNTDDLKRGLAAGADSHICKGSFQDDSFIQTVNELLKFPPLPIIT